MDRLPSGFIALAGPLFCLFSPNFCICLSLFYFVTIGHLPYTKLQAEFLFARLGISRRAGYLHGIIYTTPYPCTHFLARCLEQPPEFERHLVTYVKL